MTTTKTPETGTPQTPRPPHRDRSRRTARRVIAGVGITGLAVGAALAAGGVHLASTNSFPGHAASTPTTNCAANPSACGYPDATNTGVPSGMKLQTVGTGAGQVSSGPGWHFDSRGWVEVNGAGATLTGLYIPYNLDITASNVTIKNDQVVTSGQSSVGISVRHTSGVTLENNTITGTNATSGRVMAGIKDMYNDSSGLQVLNNNIYDAGVGVQIESGLIQGNYIHDMGYIKGDHIDGINSDGGVTGQLTINHNTVFDQMNQTTAVGLFEDFGVQANRTISNNLLAGGSYAIYAGQNSGGLTTSNITITGNRFATQYFPQSGQYGPVAAYNPSTTTWSGNVWDSTGATVPAPGS